jgi:hypothetical protein
MSERSDFEDAGGDRTMDCAGLADVAAELALGVLTGRERAAALAHLDGCPECRAAVRELTSTGEELLALLPAREPPAGFEMRVMGRLGLPVPALPPSAAGTSAVSDTDPPWALGSGDRVPGIGSRSAGSGGRTARGRPPGEQPRRRLRRTLAAAAAVLAVAGAGLAGWDLRAANSPVSASAASPVASATLLSTARQPVGEVFLDSRVPQWMYASVAIDGAGDVTVTCQLVTAAGQVADVGTFRLSDGYGYWGGPTSSVSGKITGARLITATGTVLATAAF